MHLFWRCSAAMLLSLPHKNPTADFLKPFRKSQTQRHRKCLGMLSSWNKLLYYLKWPSGWHTKNEKRKHVYAAISCCFWLWNNFMHRFLVVLEFCLLEQTFILPKMALRLPRKTQKMFMQRFLVVFNSEIILCSDFLLFRNSAFLNKLLYYLKWPSGYQKKRTNVYAAISCCCWL